MVSSQLSGQWKTERLENFKHLYTWIKAWTTKYSDEEGKPFIQKTRHFQRKTNFQAL